MDRKKVAVSMIWLVITIPLYSASALAGITSVTVEGKHHVPDLLDNANDYVEFTVIVDEEVSGNDLKTDFPEDTFFDSCSSNGTNYKCTYASEARDWGAQSYGYTITQFDNSILKDTKTGNIYVDGDEPSIETFTVSRGAGLVNFTFSVKDTACSVCGARCSGVAIVSIMEEKVIKKSFEFGSGSCSVSGKGGFSVDELSTANGKTNICIIAFDMFGKDSESICEEIEVDSSAPQAASNLVLLDSDGDKITHVPALPLYATAEMNISDDNLDEVYGDFSELNIVNPGAYKKKKASCSKDNDIYKCRWSGLLVDGPNGNVNIYINASDTHGNVLSTTQTLSLSKDTDSPEIKRVYTNPDSDELVLRKGENRIFVELDSGSGYAKEQVFLDMSGFGGNVKIAPDKCYEKTSWICEFKGRASKEDGFSGYVYVSATDDAGNTLKPAESVSATVDSTTPVIDRIELSSECAVAGQDLIIDVYVFDDTNVSMTVDASAISTGSGILRTMCVEQNPGEYICTVTVRDLVTAYIKGTVGINITDAANNVITRNQLVEICESEGTVTPNFFKVAVGSAASVDKRLLSFISIPTYVPISLSASGGAVAIEKYVSCTGAGGAYLLNSETINPTIAAKLNKGSYEGSEIEIACTLSMIVKKGRKVYSIPEEDVFNITVPLFNNALGEISDSMQGKIDSVQDQIKDLGDEIEKWEEWNKWLGMLCSFAETMAAVNSVMRSLLQVYWSIACGGWTGCLSTIDPPDCQKPFEGFWGTVCKFTTKFDDMVQRFVWPTSLVGPSPYIGTGVKYGCILYSCRICDASFFVNVGLLAAAAAWDSRSVEKTVSEYSDNFADVVFGEESHNLVRIDDMFEEIYMYKEGQPFADFWKEDGINTRIRSDIDSSTWLFNPYESIHYAKTCLCLPGYIYNLKKDRQIKCMYKTCLQENAEVGLPTDTCDVAYKERECLYVEGAQYKLHGYMGGLLESIVEALIANLPSILLGIAHKYSCGKEQFKCQTQPCPDGSRVICGLTSAAIAITQLIDIFEGGLDFSKYEADLKGRDYCSGGGS